VSLQAVPVAFARALRNHGLDVPVSNVVLFAQAIELSGDLYWSGRATLVKRPEDIAAYDDAFAAFFLGTTAPAPPPPAEAEVAAGPYSRIEVLRHKDFAAMTADEAAEARRLMATLRLPAAHRRSRRLQPTRRRGRIDIRRTIRDRHQRLHFKGPTTTPRRLVLLLDVSGSMAPYARALVRFLHAAVVARRRVDAFAVGTRVTRITKELRWRDPDRAIADAARRVQDWSGGTRLGEGLKAFNDMWGARGATVVVLSDGWDRGDPDLLSAQTQRLQRAAHKVVWVNPHKASPGYEPLARGMAAALPHVDEFVEGHSVASLEALAQVIR
jgi:uncharacterized protein